MDPLARVQDAAAQLLERAQMPQAEIARRVALAIDAGFWRGLAPELTIGAVPLPLPAAPIADADLRDAAAQFSNEGYFQVPPVLAARAIGSLNRAIDAVAANGWPPVFAWVYDQLWQCARLPAVARLLASHFGSPYAQIPHIWVHVVPAASGATGWMPHFDGFGQGRASVWLALTDATLDNGCMHLVPPRSLPDAFRQRLVESSIKLSDVLRAMQATRALPAPAGGALGWGFDVYHWGGRCVKPGAARRAISMEFLAAGEAPDADEVPLVEVDGPLPAFADRLKMIGQAVEGYGKFEPGLVRYRGIAEALCKT